MDREYAISLFREMWCDMYKEITLLERPIDICEFKFIWLINREIECIHDCPLCQYTANVSGYEVCKNCPINWASSSYEYMCEQCAEDDYFYKSTDGLWKMARDSDDWEEQAKIVKMIAELPEK